MSDSTQDDRVLTVEIARAYVADRSLDADLSIYTHIEDEAATVLGASGPLPDLNGLRTLSLTAARALVGTYSGLELNGLTELSPELAGILAKEPGDVLFLDGVTDLTDAAAEALRTYEGYLSLNGLTTLSMEAARSLSGMFGRLSLRGIQRLTPEVAYMLSRHQPDLELSGLKSLELSSALHLGEHRGGLVLDGLEVLPPDIARALSGQFHHLSLGGLSDLDMDAAYGLSAHRGTVVLSSLKHLDPRVAAVLVGPENACVLSGLDSITVPLAERLAQMRFVRLDGVRTLDPATARALARQVGALALDGITEVSFETATELSYHMGRVSMANLQLLDSPAHAPLLEHPDFFAKDVSPRNRPSSLSPPSPPKRMRPARSHLAYYAPVESILGRLSAAQFELVSDALAVNIPLRIRALARAQEWRTLTYEEWVHGIEFSVPQVNDGRPFQITEWNEMAHRIVEQALVIMSTLSYQHMGLIFGALVTVDASGRRSPWFEQLMRDIGALRADNSPQEFWDSECEKIFRAHFQGWFPPPPGGWPSVG